MGRWTTLLVLPFASGCMGFGYPSVSQTPRVNVPDANVRAFRDEGQITFTGPIMTGPVYASGSVKEIPVVAAKVEPQTYAYFPYYYLIFPFQGSTSGDMSVLLYRPGFQTVEVPARPWWRFPGWTEPERVVWKEASDLAAQMEALEKVLPKNFDREENFLDKNVREFAAREYARLAADPRALAPGMEKTRERLLDKADEYAKLAEENATANAPLRTTRAQRHPETP
jgi:hypothetical protein